MFATEVDPANSEQTGLLYSSLLVATFFSLLLSFPVVVGCTISAETYRDVAPMHKGHRKLTSASSYIEV